MEKKDLYKEFLKYSHVELRALAEKATSEEEKKFYTMLANLVVEREEKRILDRRASLC